MIAPQVQAQLKRFDDRTLQYLLHSQSPDVPAFYVLAELNRRKAMRSAAPVSVPEQTVADAVSQPQSFADGGGVRRRLEDELYGEYPITPGYLGYDTKEAIPGMFAGQERPIADSVSVAPASTREAPTMLMGDAALLAKLTHMGLKWWREGLGEKKPQQSKILLAPEENNKPSEDPTGTDNGAGLAAAIAAAHPTIGYSDVKLSRVDESVPDAFQFKDRMTERQAAIVKDRADLDLQRKRDWNNVLMQAGVSMAAGRSPDFITNAAQGLQAGLNSYNDLSADRRKRAEALTAQERNLDPESELVRYKNDVANRAVLAQRANIARANTDISNKETEYNASNRQQIDLVNLKQRGDMAMMQLRAMAKSPGKLPPGLATAAKVLSADYTRQLQETTDPEQRAALYSDLVRQWEALKRQFTSGADPSTHKGLQIFE